MKEVHLVFELSSFNAALGYGDTKTPLDVMYEKSTLSCCPAPFYFPFLTDCDKYVIVPCSTQ